MSLGRLLRQPHPPRGAALRRAAFADQAEPPLDRLVTFTNGDGFGLGWYGGRDEPGLYRNVAPAWGDANLREIAGQIEAPLFLAHVRAATGTAIQQSNCHPFRHGRWLFAHNGFIDQYMRLRRELMLAVDVELFDGIEGTTDSEVLFYRCR